MSKRRPGPRQFTADAAKRAEKGKNSRRHRPSSASSAKSAVKVPVAEPGPQPAALPRGWIATTLGEVVRSSPEKVSPYDTPHARYVGLEHIESGKGRLSGFGKASDVRSAKSVFRSGDILYGKLRPYLTKIVRPDFGGVCSTDILVLQPTPAADAAFVQYLLGARDFTAFATANSSGINLPRTSFKKLAEFRLALPPLAEQRRIVARLEELEARSRRARALLADIPAQLAQARQSLLAAAFRGDLTAEWRLANPMPELSAASTESAFDGRRLPALPATWRWTTLESICETMKIGLVRASQDQSSTSGVPYIRMQHYDLTGRWHFDDVTRVEVTAAELMAYRLAPGDILFNTRNSSELVGKVGVWPSRAGDHVFNNNLMRLRLRSENSNFVGRQMQSPQFAELIMPLKSATTSVAAIYGRDIKRLPIAIAPLSEQHEIVRRLEAALARLDATERAHAAAVADLDRLDQALLARAFSGRLVPQNPADEPAAVTLARTAADGGNPRSG